MANDMNKLYEDFERVRKTKVRQCLGFVIVGFILFIPALLFFLNVFDFKSASVFYIGFVLFVVGVILITAGFCFKSSFSKYVRNNSEKAVRDHLFPDAVLKPDEGFDLSIVMTPGFFAKPDRYQGSEYMSGHYKGVSFDKAAYDLQKQHTSTDSKGNTTTTYVTYAKGTLYRFHFARSFSTVKIIEKQGAVSFGLMSKGLETVETEYIAFNRKFKVLTNDKTTTFYLLTPQIQEQIMDIEKRYKGNFYLCFMGNDLFIAVNDSGETAKVPLFKPVSEETMRPIREFYGAPAVFVDALSLDGNKFKENAGANPTSSI